MEQLWPGALGTMLVVESKGKRSEKKKYVIKQVRRWLLGKQEFVISVGPFDSKRGKHGL